MQKPALFTLAQHVSHGQTQLAMVCFSGGWICNLVKP